MLDISSEAEQISSKAITKNEQVHNKIRQTQEALDKLEEQRESDKQQAIKAGVEGATDKAAQTVSEAEAANIKLANDTKLEILKQQQQLDKELFDSVFSSYEERVDHVPPDLMGMKRDGEIIGDIFRIADLDGDGILTLDEFLTLAEKFAAVLPPDIGLAHLTYESFAQVCDENNNIDIDGFLVWFVSMVQDSKQPLTKVLESVVQHLATCS